MFCLEIDTFDVCICLYAHASKVKDVTCLTNKKWHRCCYYHTHTQQNGKEERRNCSSYSGRTLRSACTRHLPCPSNQSYLLRLRLRLRFLLFFLLFIASSSLAVIAACLPYKHSSSFCRWWYGWRAHFPLFGLRSLARTWSCIQIGRYRTYTLMEMQRDRRKKEGRREDEEDEEKESSS